MPAYYARAAFRSTEVGPGQLVVNVIHFELDSFTSGPDWASVATEVQDWVGAEYRNVLSVAHMFHDITVTTEDYPGSTPAQGVASVELTGTRTLADSKCSPGLCEVIALKSSTPKRYARGRLFMPPALSDVEMAENGTWAIGGTYHLAVEAFATKLLTPHNAGGGDRTYTPIIFSKHQVDTAQSPFFFPVIGYSNDRVQHFLRSRTTSP